MSSLAHMCLNKKAYLKANIFSNVRYFLKDSYANIQTDWK